MASASSFGGLRAAADGDGAHGRRRAVEGEGAVRAGGAVVAQRHGLVTAGRGGQARRERVVAAGARVLPERRRAEAQVGQVPVRAAEAAYVPRAERGLAAVPHHPRAGARRRHPAGAHRGLVAVPGAHGRHAAVVVHAKAQGGAGRDVQQAVRGLRGGGGRAARRGDRHQRRQGSALHALVLTFRVDDAQAAPPPAQISKNLIPHPAAPAAGTPRRMATARPCPAGGASPRAAVTHRSLLLLRAAGRRGTEPGRDAHLQQPSRPGTSGRCRRRTGPRPSAVSCVPRACYGCAGACGASSASMRSSRARISAFSRSSRCCAPRGRRCGPPAPCCAAPAPAPPPAPRRRRPPCRWSSLSFPRPNAARKSCAVGPRWRTSSSSDR